MDSDDEGEDDDFTAEKILMDKPDPGTPGGGAILLWFVSWELDRTPVLLCFSKSEIQNPNRQTSQDL